MKQLEHKFYTRSRLKMLGTFTEIMDIWLKSILFNLSFMILAFQPGMVSTFNIFPSQSCL